MQLTINDYLIDKARAELTLYMILEAHRLQKELGFGYVESDTAPGKFNLLKAAFAHSLRTCEPLPVYAGGSDNTIYTSKEGNWAFRFCHDVAHVLLNAGFGSADEAKVSKYQADRVAKHFGKGSLEHRLFVADTLGQVAYYAVHNDFPENQLAFVRSMLTRH
ncbi:hypothetical protein bb8_p03 [Bordetella phage vB_BbrP_BB8]|uniref:Uncharacterized protein n=1 Tax=Bordetella phage vB_BbrP_BB8 TaxID=2587820 RepID=A0A4Y5TNN8_9CAUD|nr:hypothetical protein bb8_p03 [Bordetella phage vB_BbrP_BB8]